MEWIVRAVLYSDLVRGVSAQEIAPARGVATGSVKRWARLAGKTFAASSTDGGVVRMRMGADPPCNESRRYQRPPLADRSFIQVARALEPQMSMRQVARELG